MKLPPRPSTWALMALFIVTLVTYYWVRPVPAGIDPPPTKQVVRTKATRAPTPHTTTAAPSQESTATTAPPGGSSTGSRTTPATVPTTMPPTPAPTPTVVPTTAPTNTPSPATT